MSVVPISELQYRAGLVRNQTAGGGNTNIKVGELLRDMIDTLDAGSGGGGDVTGPASSVDGEIVVYNGLTGKILKNSGLLISDLALAGNGLTKTGQTLSVLANGSTINVSASGIKVSDLGIGTGQIADTAVTFAKMQTIGALSVVANATNATAAPAALAASVDGQALVRSGTTLAFSTLAIGAFADGIITLAKLANIAALSVVGNGTNASAVPTALTGTTDQVFRVSSAGTSAGFGAINLASASAVSGLLAFANIANGSARSVFGRSANSSGVQASIAGGGANTVLIDNGTTLSFTTLALGSLANISALSVLGNGTNASAAVTALAAATDGDVMRRSGTTVGFGAPNFAAQNITTTGVISLGTTPALSGQVRIPNAQDIRARNVGNTNDLILVRLDSSDTVSLGDVSGTGIRLTLAGVHGFRVSGVDAMTLSSTILSVPAGAISIGTTPAAAGALRIGSTASISSRNNANSADVVHTRTNSSDGLFLGEGAASYVIGDAKIVIGTNIEITVSQFRWDSAVATPSLIQETDATNGVTGDLLDIASQSCSGTTSTGGGIRISSGTGTTDAGNVTLRRGATTVFSATSTATAMGNSTILVEGASLSGSSIVALARGSAISATQMPANTGNGVVYLANCTTAPTANSVSGYVLYANASGVHVRGPSGTVTTIAVA